ncbi:hypothetical protein BJX70DRAFT_306914 [Aspergillus crustosus]
MSSFRDQLRALPVLQPPFPPLQNPLSLPSTPQETFRLWLADAIAANIPAPHAVTVSTVSPDGSPDARVVILKDVDARGWHFAIKGDSPKGSHIAQNNHVALTFFWAEVGRSIRIRGVANAGSAEEAGRDFEDRPLGSRIAAVASRQSLVLGSREELLLKVKSTTERVEEGGRGGLEMREEIDWKVYAVDPVSVEFWQGSSDRLHHRVRFVRGEGGDGWVKELLWP